MPMDAMIIPLNPRRPNPANAAPSFDPARHLAVEPPAWTVSLSGAADDTPPSPALAAPFRLLSAAGVAAAERASPKFLTDLARHPAVIDAVSALTGTCMVPAPCGTQAAAGAVDLVLSLSKEEKSSEKKKRIRVTLVRDTYKQALRGLFVTGTSESA